MVAPLANEQYIGHRVNNDTMRPIELAISIASRSEAELISAIDTKHLNAMVLSIRSEYQSFAAVNSNATHTLELPFACSFRPKVSQIISFEIKHLHSSPVAHKHFAAFLHNSD